MPCPMHPVHPLSPDHIISLVMYPSKGRDTDIVTKHVSQNGIPDTPGTDKDKRGKPSEHGRIDKLGNGAE